ncbi:hypothetical protein N7527_001662 [Penicillium freii]|nr:hypothetical protein N7527_001662 [Penicillium freii]
MRTGNGFIRTVPGGRKADPIILDNAFARTGKRELVKIRAWAPIIVLDLYSSLYGCFLLPNIYLTAHDSILFLLLVTQQSPQKLSATYPPTYT